jgi:hypothetical protein
MTFTGTLTIRDLKDLGRYQAKFLRRLSTTTLVTILCSALIGFSTLYLLFFGYSFVLWLSIVTAAVFMVVLVPTFQAHEFRV